MSDDSDKTVFQQPRPGMDRTVMRPSPGRRRAAAQPRAPQPQQQAPARAMAGGRPSLDTEAAYFRTASGLNPLVNAASTLIAVFEKTRQSMSHPDVAGLHTRLTNEIRAFEGRLRDLGYKQEIMLSARYVMCAALDEAVLNTPWGSNSPWAQRTLLTVFHNETSGGEKFFLILDRMRQTPGENLDMLELIYICLSLGFEGKYRLANRGRDQLEHIRDELFSVIRSYRGEYERALSENWQGLGNIRRTLTDHIPMWVIVTIAVAILFFGYSGFRYWLYKTSAPVAEKLVEISTIEEQENSNKKPQ
ncbi:type IVB secretion system protein IcmH/DotU [Teredinibacter sp. KSP-S5-2]|uniref:type IVB secretion system protein IcmH/DotU n=1 Tax=Teredinibacter sp. KSP-S5-2 TaxID=3034506 RepID=UPI002934E6E5|nr:type IVB secretion system protein IcmH/DotU [Teredinibacter sp. KSP-S5-2]WNO08065.1 type IVB secretion system protein IcmH/DotU [Teredinibacter sp. KSP-S5-2]